MYFTLSPSSSSPYVIFSTSTPISPLESSLTPTHHKTVLHAHSSVYPRIHEGTGKIDDSED
jgi:hypothetical protein